MINNATNTKLTIYPHMKLIQNTYETLVFNNPSQLPEGAIRLTSLTDNVAEQNASRQAMITGRIQGYKIVKSLKDLQSGHLYVDKAQCEHYLTVYRKGREKAGKRLPEPVAKESKEVQLPLAVDDSVAVLLRELITVQKQTLTKLASIEDFCANSAIGVAQFIEEAKTANRLAANVSNGTHEFSLNTR